MTPIFTLDGPYGSVRVEAVDEFAAKLQAVKIAAESGNFANWNDFVVLVPAAVAPEAGPSAVETFAVAEGGTGVDDPSFAPAGSTVQTAIDTQIGPLFFEGPILTFPATAEPEVTTGVNAGLPDQDQFPGVVGEQFYYYGEGFHGAPEKSLFDWGRAAFSDPFGTLDDVLGGPETPTESGTLSGDIKDVFQDIGGAALDFTGEKIMPLLLIMAMSRR